MFFGGGGAQVLHKNNYKYKNTDHCRGRSGQDSLCLAFLQTARMHRQRTFDRALGVSSDTDRFFVHS